MWTPRALLWAALCFALAFLHEAAGASLRARKGAKGDDDGDDGDGGMAGALSSLMGGGGGGDADDDDPNMVGTHKKKSGGGGGAKGGIDVSGLEEGLEKGGVGQLTQMLKMMRAAHTPIDTHIKKGENGEEMYDFRDLDDGAPTTPMPVISVTEKPELKLPTQPMFEIPDMPKIQLPGKGGVIQGLDKAEAQAKENRANIKAMKATQKTAGGLVVWGQSPPVVAAVAAKPPVAAQPAVATQPAVAAPAVMGGVPAAPGMPMYQAMAPVGMPGKVPMGAAPAESAGGLYQGLAAMKQSMDMLMSQVAGMQARPGSAPVADASVAPLAAKLDQLSQSVTSEEHKMDQRVEAVEAQNAAMKKQLEEEASELKELKQELGAKKGEPAVQVATPAPEAKSEHKAKKAHKAKKSHMVKSHVQTDKSVQAAPPKAAPTSAPAPKVVVTPAPVVVTPPPAPVVTPAPAPVVTAAPPAKVVAPAPVAKKVVAAGSVYETKPWDATFTVHLDGMHADGKETFTIRVHPEWAPEGAKRFQDIVRAGILNDAKFFRVVPGFMVQFGIPGSPKVASVWEKKRIKDDEVLQSNTRGMMSFATSGKNTRTTQMFINYGNNDFLDKQGFSPFAEVLDDGMEVVDKLQSKYRERPNQGKIQHHGNKYLNKHFPQLSSVDSIVAKFSIPPPAAAGLIQNSATPIVANQKAYKHKGIATFYHQKVKMAE